MEQLELLFTKRHESCLEQISQLLRSCAVKCNVKVYIVVCTNV